MIFSLLWLLLIIIIIIISSNLNHVAYIFVSSKFICFFLHIFVFQIFYNSLYTGIFIYWFKWIDSAIKMCTLYVVYIYIYILKIKNEFLSTPSVFRSNVATITKQCRGIEWFLKVNQLIQCEIQLLLLLLLPLIVLLLLSLLLLLPIITIIIMVIIVNKLIQCRNLTFSLTRNDILSLVYVCVCM